MPSPAVDGLSNVTVTCMQVTNTSSCWCYVILMAIPFIRVNNDAGKVYKEALIWTAHAGVSSAPERCMWLIEAQPSGNPGFRLIILMDCCGVLIVHLAGKRVLGVLSWYIVSYNTYMLAARHLRRLGDIHSIIVPDGRTNWCMRLNLDLALVPGTQDSASCAPPALSKLPIPVTHQYWCWHYVGFHTVKIHPRYEWYAFSVLPLSVRTSFRFPSDRGADFDYVCKLQDGLTLSNLPAVCMGDTTCYVLRVILGLCSLFAGDKMAGTGNGGFGFAVDYCFLPWWIPLANLIGE
ncbi:hypothetical protein EDD85DRAFT_798827 [Armillaria nabsnona]|nr:hypothetical protein EDD85DRAFT_798827 [Armillaria nabsnona]